VWLAACRLFSEIQAIAFVLARVPSFVSNDCDRLLQLLVLALGGVGGCGSRLSLKLLGKHLGICRSAFMITRSMLLPAYMHSNDMIYLSTNGQRSAW